MTIKKRLFISNILMLVIPAVLAIIVLISCLFIFLVSMFPHAEDRLGFHEELTETRYRAVELVADWLSDSNGDRKNETESALSQLAETNQITIQIYHDQNLLQEFGNTALPSYAQLEQSLAVLNGEGTVSNGSFELYGRQISAGGVDYQVYVYNPVVTLASQNLKVWAAGIGFFMIVALLFIIFLTNRFLIRFVFRRISDPLKTLAEGVHQIRDGNLTHRIDYQGKDEFQPICEDFNEMAERLRASVEQSQKEEESRKELLASISHDIRSPLTSIRAYVEGLLDGVADTPEKQRAYLSTIQTKTIEIDEMVRKLFLFSKMELGEFPYSPERLNAVKEIKDIVSASAEEYRRRGLQIKIGAMPNSAIIEADPTYFHSILTNLLDNSAKYKEKDIGTAIISARTNGQYFRLLVEDDGPGVPTEALPKLFDVFYRSDPSRENPNQGSGLGLAIVAKTMERMGGAICAENLSNGGLRMVLEIPLVRGGKDNETNPNY